MEKQLSYFFILSLKEIALRRVAINLWSEREILVSIEKYSLTSRELFNDYSDYSVKWRKTFESQVRGKMSKLVLPQSLAKQLLFFVTPIGSQIRKWKVFHEFYLKMPFCEEIFEKYFLNSRIQFDAPILSKLCWTTAGTIDFRETAKELIRCEMVDIVKCYTLACLYCLDEWIPAFWEKLPEEIKREFYNEDTSQMKWFYLEFCWPYILKGEESKLLCLFGGVDEEELSFNQNALISSLSRGNKAAAEYFLQKLSRKEKEAPFLNRITRIAVRSRFIFQSGYLDEFPKEQSCNVVSYLLSLMNHEQQMEIFKDKPLRVLLCFQDWPSQDIFLKMAELFWAFLPPDDYEALLSEMISYFAESKCYFQSFFHEFFTHSPINFRKKFVDIECLFGSLFEILFDIEDSDTIRIIFRNVDAEDRVRLVSSDSIFRLFCNCILKDRLHMLEVCLREVTLSRDERETLKEAFIEFQSTRRRLTKKDKRLRNRFIHILEEMFER